MKTHTICISCNKATTDYWGGSTRGQLPPPNGDVWEWCHLPDTTFIYGLCWPTLHLQWL